MKVLAIFPGWGTPEKLYQNLDVVVDKRIIITNFNLIDIKEKLANYEQDELIFCGWSLGAMRVLECLEYFPVDKLILLAPTLYFLADQPEIIVKKMKKNLKMKKLKTLIEFTKLNFNSVDKCKEYLQDYKKKLNELNKNYLKQGLNFLLERDLRNLECEQKINPLIIVGEEDKVIKNSSSKKVLAQFEGGDYFSLSEVGHNMIYEAEDEVNQLIRDYLYKV